MVKAILSGKSGGKADHDRQAQPVPDCLQAHGSHRGALVRELCYRTLQGSWQMRTTSVLTAAFVYDPARQLLPNVGHNEETGDEVTSGVRSTRVGRPPPNPLELRASRR